MSFGNFWGASGLLLVLLGPAFGDLWVALVPSEVHGTPTEFEGELYEPELLINSTSG